MGRTGYPAQSAARRLVAPCPMGGGHLQAIHGASGLGHYLGSPALQATDLPWIVQSTEKAIFVSSRLTHWASRLLLDPLLGRGVG